MCERHEKGVLFRGGVLAKRLDEVICERRRVLGEQATNEQ